MFEVQWDGYETDVRFNEVPTLQVPATLTTLIPRCSIRRVLVMRHEVSILFTSQLERLAFGCLGVHFDTDPKGVVGVHSESSNQKPWH